MRRFGVAEALHLGALLPAAVGACCTLGARRSGRVAALASALVMLLAMLDTTAGLVGLPALTWSAVLVLTALVVAATGRLASPTGARAGAGTGPVRLGHASAMAVHGGIGLIAMAALLAVMGSPSMGGGVAGVSGLAGATGLHHAGGASGVLGAAVAVGVLAYGGFSGMLAVRLARDAGVRRRRRALAALEVAAMGASALLMLAAIAGGLA